VIYNRALYSDNAQITSFFEFFFLFNLIFLHKSNLRNYSQNTTMLKIINIQS